MIKDIRGFTLIELLVVIIILGLLAGIVIPRVVGRVDEAKVDTTKVQLKAIKGALDQFRLDNGFYPTTEQGIEAFVKRPEIPPAPVRWRQYLDELPKDGWGRPFIYMAPGLGGRPYDLVSRGADDIEGTDDDLSLWSE